MARTIFMNLPVVDVKASTAFYEANDFVRDEMIAKGPDAVMLCWSDGVSFMLLSHARFATFAPSRAETVVELTYRTTLSPWLTVQPDAQYVMDPSAGRTLADALALGASGNRVLTIHGRSERSAACYRYRS